MGFALIGKKIGMTRVYTEKGVSTPVTVIQCGPCVVTQLKSPEKDGYGAVQLGFEDVKPRNSTMPIIGHDNKAGTSPKRTHREFRATAEELAGYTLGQVLTVDKLTGQMYVDVIGISKGKGFAGVMKRYRFKGICASHGTERKHRSPGSIGGYCSNRGFGGGLAKGKKMPGRMGNAQITTRCLDIVRIDAENNILLVKGPVPGANRGTVFIRSSVRLYRGKAKKVAEAAAK